MHPKEIAAAAADLRDRTVALLDQLTNDELERVALPEPEEGGAGPWTVADVLRHLAESDRQTVLGRHLLSFVPFADPVDFERHNDEMLARLRGESRYQLREELITWGERLQRLIRWSPSPLTRMTVPTMFGRVSLAWFATLRVYDEWVHQDDIARALDRDAPPMDARTRDLLAEFQLRALPALPLRSVDRRSGVVEVAFDDALTRPAWRFDLSSRKFGPRVDAEPTVRVDSDVATWTRIAADRTPWRDEEAAGRLRIEGDDRDAAIAILDVVRVV